LACWSPKPHVTNATNGRPVFPQLLLQPFVTTDTHVYDGLIAQLVDTQLIRIPMLEGGFPAINQCIQHSWLVSRSLHLHVKNAKQATFFHWSLLQYIYRQVFVNV
jgi:hypothetical protein